MAPRKDVMRLLRRDAGFSEALGFGVGASLATDAHADGGGFAGKEEERGGGRAESPAAEIAFGGTEGVGSEGAGGRADEVAPEAARNRNGLRSAPAAARGKVVYVAVSLSAAQASRAEAWAAAARCAVPLLMRRTAQRLRDELCEEWFAQGLPEITEMRGTRGKYPTSVTLTLPVEIAEALAARHDPLAIAGLGRVLGPAFRARFEEAFDEALASAGF